MLIAITKEVSNFFFFFYYHFFLFFWGIPGLLNLMCFKITQYQHFYNHLLLFTLTVPLSFLLCMSSQVALSPLFASSLSHFLSPF